MFSPLLKDRASTMEKSTAFSIVTDAELPVLQKALAAQKSQDPYARSAAYFGLTGRHGLWQIKDGDSFILVCIHPNIENEYLIFPPHGEKGDELLSKTIHTFVRMGLKASVARAESLEVAKSYLNQIEEPVLDWKYPVHTLDTNSLTHHQGKGFQHFRQKLNALDMANVEADDLIPARDKKAVKEVISLWANGDQDMVEPYNRLIDLFDVLPLQGRIIYYNRTPVALSIWEETDPENGFSNAYAHVALHEIKGLSQFVFLDMGQTLNARGFKNVCVGGSESEGLDRFKRNLCPVASLNLSSYVVLTAEPAKKAVAA